MASQEKKRTGRFEDPELVPVMNLVCVLIPLVLWTTTWLSFGEIAVSRGSGDPAGGRTGEKEQKLRLVAVLTSGSLTLMADRGLAGAVMPEDPATKTRGRIDIPHRTLSLAEIAQQRASCRATADAAFDDCAFWAYLGQFVGICYENPAGAVKVPDLKALNLALRGIKDAVLERFPAGLDDQDQINIKSEDGIPYCQIVALMDFARLRRFGYDWSADPEFKDGVDEALKHGVIDPLLEPSSWNDAMRRELLFPGVQFVN